LIRDGGKVFCGVDAQVRSLWKVLPEQAISVLMRAALPGAGGVTEIQRYKSPLRKVLVAGQFGAMIQVRERRRWAGRALIRFC
jgi:hypothetical protein